MIPNNFYFSKRYSATVLFLLMLNLMMLASSAQADKDKSCDLVRDGVSLLKYGISENLCVMTFDDGPSKYTAKLLDILKEHNVPATFFVVGAQVVRRPQLLKRMQEEGHEVGNHSYSHNKLRHMSQAAQEEDLRKLDVLLRALGIEPRFVRPPFGAYDNNTVEAVRGLDGRMILWSIDSMDWRKKAAVSNLRSVLQGSALRGVFLFHDVHQSTVENMPEILNDLSSSGCKFVTLSGYIDGVQSLTAEKAKPDLKSELKPDDLAKVVETVGAPKKEVVIPQVEVKPEVEKTQVQTKPQA